MQLSTSIATTAFLNALETRFPGWHRGPDSLMHPSGFEVFLSNEHASDVDGHIDVAYTHPRTRGVRLWDCIAGIGDNDMERAEFAAHVWATTTATTMLELGALDGTYCDHYHSGDMGGLKGWHVLASAIVGYGRGDAPSQLQQWLLDNPPLQALGDHLRAALGQLKQPTGVKVLFGGDGLAEVRVNGVCSNEASDALRALPWPRLEELGYVRMYFVAMHPE